LLCNDTKAVFGKNYPWIEERLFLQRRVGVTSGPKKEKLAFACPACRRRHPSGRGEGEQQPILTYSNNDGRVGSWVVGLQGHTAEGV